MQLQRDVSLFHAACSCINRSEPAATEALGGAMPRLDNSIDSRAPRETVFQYVADVTARPEWVKWTKQAEVTSPQQKGLGATDAGTMQVGPRKENVEAIVTEYKENELFTRRHTRGLELTDRLPHPALGEPRTKMPLNGKDKPPLPSTPH